MASKDKFLGVTLDPDLSGTTMANSVIGKGNRGLRILYRKAKFFKLVEMKMVCSSLLQAHIDYAFNVWTRELLKTLNSKTQVDSSSSHLQSF